ncbi:MAG: PD-(D/E)XK nuclease family protein [Alistipes sp.]|nr:PD-(D/E)XK nuclease family protein [Alistipes sp.]
MRTFLYEVARKLYDRHGDDISSLSILFPSRRARVFFLDALSDIAERPLWQPEWLTIDELMSEISGLAVGDRLRLITELYKVYSQYHDEPFDKFYFWGDMLLADFDTIDKYRIDADMLFRNISDIREMEADMSYLTPEQLRIVNFWRNFSDTDLSPEKRNFLALWKTLAPIYRRFRERLAETGTAYTGMVHRAAAELMDAGKAELKPRRYIIAGFNALSACEKRLFKYLAATADTAFYWDSDDYYVSNPEQEAGMFVRENISMFPAADEISHDNFRHITGITAVSAVSNAVQCKYVSEILKKLSAEGPLDKETAIVLTDENLLMPLLFALPEEAGKVNVTMGYPLVQSPAYSFVERLLGLQSRCRMKNGQAYFYHSDVTGLLSHPYIADLPASAALAGEIRRNRRITVPREMLADDGLMSVLFRKADDRRQLSEYLSDAVAAVARLPYEGNDSARRVEFLAVLAENIAKLGNSADGCDVEMGIQTYASLLRRHLQTVRIPFNGEPLEGLQVMGILETRNLDFRNVIILSMNDDNFPGNRIMQSSFIPYNLRFAYGMPTPEHHEGVYAYYFYRLIQRCKNLYMLYCSHADDKSTGEPSRYIRQLELESGFKVRKTEVGVDVNLFENEPIEIPKRGATLETLQRYLAEEDPKTIWPTAFSHYVSCPLMFYFADIARIRPEEEIGDEIDNRIFGNIFHLAAQSVYSEFIGRLHAGEALRAAKARVGDAVTAAIDSEYLHDGNAAADDYGGDLLLIRNVLTEYLNNILDYDAANDGFAVRSLESKISCDFEFEIKGRRAKVHFEGISDRIDVMEDGTVRIVDYKTGAKKLEYRDTDSLFDGTAADRNANIIKTILYAMMMYHSGEADVRPALYYVRAMHSDDYSPLLKNMGRIRANGVGEGEMYSVCRDEFEAAVARKLSELFDTDIPFRQCEDTNTCRFCDYKTVCGRG